MKTFIRNNGLSISFFLLFVGAFVGQIFFGFKEYNKDLIENGVPAVHLFSYFATGHFVE